MVVRVIEVSPVASGAEERVSLDIDNACRPRDAVTLDELGYRPGIGRIHLQALPAAE